MKLKDYLAQFKGLDPDTEILHGDKYDYECFLNLAMGVEKRYAPDMSDDFRNHACWKVIFFE
jgi:hypothetical protein